VRRRLRVLDLFCGAGGVSAGWHAAGFDVHGVDIDPQPDYPFGFTRADALTFDLTGWDVVVASPVCKRYSTATPEDRREAHPDQVGPMRHRLVEAVSSPGGPAVYVIENVPGAPLADPVLVCGDTLRLGVRRHRLFESNVPLVGTGCHHDRGRPAVPVYGSYGQRVTRADPADPGPPRGTEAARQAMGIDWMPWPALTQAIPPAYAFWVAVQVRAHLAGMGRDAFPAGEPSRADGSPLGDDGTHPTDGVTHPAGGFRHPQPVAQEGNVTALPAGPICRCGNPLPPRPASGRWPRHCSPACRQAAYRDRQRERATA
jgi:hypothetical protein